MGVHGGPFSAGISGSGDVSASVAGYVSYNSGSEAFRVHRFMSSGAFIVDFTFIFHLYIFHL